MTEKPKPRSLQGEKELDKVEQQFDDFNAQVKDLTLDNMNRAPRLETESQTKLSQNDLRNAKDIYLKPKTSILSREKFNERFRDAYTYDKEYVHFVAENNEVKGEYITIWTKPYAGLPAEEWEVPVNKPIWGPRYLAEQIRKCTYHQLHMDESRMVSSESGIASYHGQMVASKTVNRLNAEPVSKGRSVFVSSDVF